jgi:hypothetical protein
MTRWRRPALFAVISSSQSILFRCYFIYIIPFLKVYLLERLSSRSSYRSSVPYRVQLSLFRNTWFELSFRAPLKFRVNEL